MTYHITSSILLLHQKKVLRTNAPLRLHSHQRLCPYEIFKVEASLLYWFYLGRIGYGFKVDNCGLEKTWTDKTCIGWRSEVLFIAELAKS